MPNAKPVFLIGQDGATAASASNPVPTSGGGGGGGDVNITEVGGNAVTTTLPVSGTVSITGVATAENQTSQITQETSAATSLAIMDDWDESDRAKVNPIAGQAGVAAGAGTVSALTQRMTMASDDPAVTALGAVGDSSWAGSGNSSIIAALKAIFGLGVTPPLAVTPAAATGNLTDRSGTITTGGTSQTLAALNLSRKYLFIQNPINATETLFINFTTAASTTAKNSVELAPGGSLIMMLSGFLTTELVAVTAVTTGHAFICKEG